MARVRRLAAVDLGAESGRVVLGELRGSGIVLRVAHRFENRPVRLPDGLHWNLAGLFEHVLTGLAAAAGDGRLDGVGVDAWGVDYGLLDARGRLLGLPYHYRDERTSPAMVATVHQLVGREELYRRTGIQTLAINTIFQLFAERDGAALAAADRLLFIADLIAMWLSGVPACEATGASTSGLLDATSGRWAHDIIARLGLPDRPFAVEPVQPGATLGPLLDIHSQAGHARGAPVRAVASHDTACAFLAAPISGPGAAILSSGTWSLLGVELAEPRLGADAAAFNLTNERGVEGTIRLLRNVMGLWLVQEARRALAERSGQAVGYEQLARAAAAHESPVALFDPDDELLLRGGDLPAKIEALCRGSGQPPPSTPGALVRSILASLACKYRLVAEQLELVTGRAIETVHVVGGGCHNQLLCQLTADLLGVPVLAGPEEATALGNALLQARALGDVASLAQMRELSRRSTVPVRYEPADPYAEKTYERFLALTGLGSPEPAARRGERREELV